MKPHEWSEQLLDAMINADRSGAAELIGNALANGIEPQQVIAEVLDPAIVRLGHLWEKETMSLAQNFVASKIAEDTLLRCVPDKTDSLCTKGAIVLGNIEDDFHSLGRKAVGLFLSAAGWDVYDLGNDVPAEELLEKAIEVNACAIGASAMMQTTALNIRKLRQLIDERGLTDRIKLAVGGAVFNWRPELVSEVGGDGTANNAVGADELFMRLQAEVMNRQGTP
ncbi:cobalamin-dependent protein [Geobacter pelophilus]|jgi:methanogenic corrinoid protein MtbC1|uniref:Cobalamin-dependent protein n=1 Tax=Geoanaerobacter pelophilus TaxID=60036 RepID=A0AAW4KY71_9BACT|nr:cobalamin-dependent protein [Geoanaerobacter pelophilus]MBT0663679.1 cobalamin-dependent protein [Geoanaerobacter pelophilus]